MRIDASKKSSVVLHLGLVLSFLLYFSMPLWMTYFQSSKTSIPEWFTYSPSVALLPYLFFLGIFVRRKRRSVIVWVGVTMLLMLIGFPLLWALSFPLVLLVKTAP